MAKKLVDPARTTPWTMWTDAKYYRIAANVLIERASSPEATELLQKQLVLPVFTLLSMSIESALKAYLYAAGIDPNALKYDYQHDLVALADEVERQADGRAKQLINEVRHLFVHLNPPYKGKEFQYRVIGHLKVPYPVPLHDWVAAFLQETKPFVGERNELHCARYGVQTEPPED